MTSNTNTVAVIGSASVHWNEFTDNDRYKTQRKNQHQSSTPTRLGGVNTGPPFNFSHNNGGIYVLHCDEDTYYIGVTDDYEKRMSEHFSGVGALWTKKHHPQSVIETYPWGECQWKDGTIFEIEDEITITYMKKHGVANVRGGSWAHPNHDVNPPLPANINTNEQNCTSLDKIVDDVFS
jgi:hypothetical protein